MRNNVGKKVREGTSKLGITMLIIGLLSLAIIISFLFGGIFNYNAPNNNNTNNTNNTLPMTINFDFDNGSPSPTIGLTTPFNYTSGGVMARFSSPHNPGAFSVQSGSKTFFVLSEFSGQYLYDNEVPRNPLIIEFNRSLTSITLTFATVEYHGGLGDNPSYISVNAYMNSTALQLIGTMTSRGTWPNGSSFPQGTVSFNSSGESFNMVRIELPIIGSALATDFLLDNIIVVTKA